VIHVDVMDGHFVPRSRSGRRRRIDRRPGHRAGGAIDVHLMIERPEDHIEEFAKAGADCITFHAEATRTSTGP
jgi:ribulose-phosphate 3-epimerase